MAFFLFFSLGWQSLGHAMQREDELFAASMSLYNQAQFDESSKILLSLAKQNPQKSLYWFNLGNCAFMMGKFEKASEFYKKTIGLHGPLTPAAKLYEAKTLRQLGKFDEAAALLGELRRKKVPPGIRAAAADERKTLKAQQDREEAALAAYQAGNFKDAERMIEQEPETERSSSARLLLGLSLAKQGKSTASNEVLQKLSEPGAMAESDRSEIRDLLKNGPQPTTPYWLSLDLSAGETNNAYIDGRSVAPVASTLIRGTLGTGYRFHSENSWSQKVGYILNYENPLQAPTLETVVQTAQAVLTYRKAQLEASVTPYVQEQFWDNTAVSERLGLTLKASSTSDHHEYGLDLDLSSQRSIDTDFTYLSGDSYSLRPYYGFWRSSFYAQVYWLAGFDGTQDIVYSDASVLPMKQTYQGPGAKLLWKISDRAALAWNLSYLQRVYPDPALPENVQRKDGELGTWLKYSYLMGQQLWIYGLGEYTQNSSTLGAGDVRDKNYDILTFTVGVSWNAFQ